MILFSNSVTKISLFFVYSTSFSSRTVAAASLYVLAISDIASDTLFNLYTISSFCSNLLSGALGKYFISFTKSSILIFIFFGIASNPIDAIKISWTIITECVFPFAA